MGLKDLHDLYNMVVTAKLGDTRSRRANDGVRDLTSALFVIDENCRFLFTDAAILTTLHNRAPRYFHLIESPAHSKEKVISKLGLVKLNHVSRS